MEALHQCCVGLDLGKQFLVACLLKGKSNETRNYNADTPDTRSLLDLSKWLKSEGCEPVAMEATGSF